MIPIVDILKLAGIINAEETLPQFLDKPFKEVFEPLDVFLKFQQEESPNAHSERMFCLLCFFLVCQNYYMVLHDELKVRE